MNCEVSVAEGWSVSGAAGWGESGAEGGASLLWCEREQIERRSRAIKSAVKPIVNLRECTRLRLILEAEQEH